MTGIDLIAKALDDLGFQMSDITPTGDDNIGEFEVIKKTDPSVSKKFTVAPLIDAYGALHMFHMNAQDAAEHIAQVHTMFANKA